MQTSSKLAMEKFQISNPRYYKSINNSHIKLAIDIEKVLDALNFHNNSYMAKYGRDDRSYYYKARDIHLIFQNTATIKNMYILVVIRCLKVEVIKTVNTTHEYNILAIFKVDALNESNTVITDISPHGLCNKKERCGRICSTIDCLNVLRGNNRCCDRPDYMKQYLFSNTHSHFYINNYDECMPKLKFPTIETGGYIQRDITYVTATIIQLKDSNDKKLFLNYKTLSVLDAKTWSGYMHWLDSTDLPTELQANILRYC